MALITLNLCTAEPCTWPSAGICPTGAEGFFFWRNLDFSLAASSTLRYIDVMDLPLPMLPSTIRLGPKSNIIWCFTGCSEFRRGEQIGARLLAGQRHERPRTAVKTARVGGVPASKGVGGSPNGICRYGRESARIAVNWHQTSRAVTSFIKHPRQDSNL